MPPARLALSSCFALLAACATPAAESGDSDVDTDTDAPVERDWDALEGLFEGVHAPAVWYWTVREWRDGSSACPSVARTSDTVWTLSGGCTAADGTVYDGTIEYLDADIGQRVLFVGWHVVTPDADLLYDGEIVLPNSRQLQSEYAARDPDGVIVYAYDGHTITTIDAWQTVYDRFETGQFTYGGRFTAAGSGAFSISGNAEHKGQCAREPDQGTLIFTGPSEVAFTFNGAAICEGCVPFVDAYGPGDICPWREE